MEFDLLLHIYFTVFANIRATIFYSPLIWTALHIFRRRARACKRVRINLLSWKYSWVLVAARVRKEQKERFSLVLRQFFAVITRFTSVSFLFFERREEVMQAWAFCFTAFYPLAFVRWRLEAILLFYPRGIKDVYFARCARVFYIRCASMY